MHTLLVYLISFFKTKVYSSEELDYKNKKFDIRKFFVVSCIVFLTIITLTESYLIYNLAKKYQKMEILYSDSLVLIKERTEIYQKEIDEYKLRFDNLDGSYKRIEECLNGDYKRQKK